MSEEELNQVADFLYEVGMLQHTPRSGFQFLGSGNQSVAEHMHRASIIAFILAIMAKNKNPYRVAVMASLHDVSESRISDLNYVHQKYNQRLEDKAHKDLISNLPKTIGQEVEDLIEEYEDRQTIESKLVKDADNLEWILSLKEQLDIGNERAKEWLKSAKERLKTDEARRLIDYILSSQSDRWWFGNPDDEWWIHRGKNQ